MKRIQFIKPESVSINIKSGRLDNYTGHYKKRLSQMKGFYADNKAYNNLLEKRDIIIYEVYEIAKSTKEGDLISGSSIIYPGKVGKEYFMTKGHSHFKADRSEVYYCLSGKGIMLMETPDGKTEMKEMKSGTIVYVPPYWAHRSINTGKKKLILLFIYPADAGHQYGYIEKMGMRKIVFEIEGRLKLKDNPEYVR